MFTIRSYHIGSFPEHVDEVKNLPDLNACRQWLARNHRDASFFAVVDFPFKKDDRARVVKYCIRCPHPDCTAVLFADPLIQAGPNKCVCHGCDVKLSWATTSRFTRYPYLQLAQKEPVAEKPRKPRKAKREFPEPEQSRRGLPLD